jgi:hypothetical protein
VLLPARRPVKVVGDLTVEATVLSPSLKEAREVFAAVGTDGLYFIPHWGHFALRLGGCVLHAGLGRVYRGPPPRGVAAAREAPERVKECRRGRCGGARGACRYYHDPEDYPDSSDVRNYMADSWLYTPAASPARYGTRRIGSAESFEADMRAVGLDDARRFLDQTAHDVLCALLLWNHVIRPQRGALAPKSRDEPPRR